MFDNMDFSKMGEMLKVAQENAQKMQEEAKNKEYTSKSGGGLISVSISGEGEINDISIDDSLLSDKESLQILLISATNDAIKMVEDSKKQAAAQMLSGMGGFGAKG
ncbi:YbaB/EbfC family nucleoid-associated protein [Sulfurospirillum arcachonense]|uniref:YbaB/EbfC family nucleoid-associated protein n=1 Tax=Sulfurospirillum arcachonense TaxID=57666 RepID=UPI0004694E06|nr:YbaB/EbfC family nucleoid-associated protein [Sulfurospirillum arcachonense]